MDEPRGALEGLSSAMVSKDLTVKKEGKRGDVDFIIALGATGVRLKPGATAMLSLALTHSVSSAKEALSYVVTVARHLNLKRGWKIKARELIVISEKALKYHADPTCPKCNGTKFDKIPGAPSLSATPCRTCHGTGKRPYPIRNGRQIAEIVYSLEDTNRVIEKAVKKRLR